MDLIVERVDVWAAEIKDKPGGLTRKLTGLQEAGVDLDFAIARRVGECDGGQAGVYPCSCQGSCGGGC